MLNSKFSYNISPIRCPHTESEEAKARSSRPKPWATRLPCKQFPYRIQSADSIYLRLTEVLDLQTLTLIKLSLHREGLCYRVLFEHSLYVGAYLLGNRGAIVEVKEADYADAVATLQREGLPVDGPLRGEDFGPLHELELLTESLPLLGRFSFTFRLLALAFLLCVLLALLIYWLVLG